MTPQKRFRDRLKGHRVSVNVEDRREARNPYRTAEIDSAGYPFGHHMTGEKPDLTKPVPHGAPAFDLQNEREVIRAQLARRSRGWMRPARKGK